MNTLNLFATQAPCPICEHGSLVPTRFTEEVQYRETPVSVEIEASVCDRCGEEIIHPDQIRRNDVTLRNAFKAQVGLLSDSRIKAIRNFLGLTQREASEIFGGGPNSFAKYETGRVAQSHAVDLLLRLAGEDSNIVQRLQRHLSQWESVYSYREPDATFLSVYINAKNVFANTCTQSGGVVSRVPVTWESAHVPVRTKVILTGDENEVRDFDLFPNVRFPSGDETIATRVLFNQRQ